MRYLFFLPSTPSTLSPHTREQLDNVNATLVVVEKKAGAEGHEKYKLAGAKLRQQHAESCDRNHFVNWI